MTVVIYNRYDSFVLASPPSLATLPYGGDFRGPPLKARWTSPPPTSRGPPDTFWHLFFNSFPALSFGLTLATLSLRFGSFFTFWMHFSFHFGSFWPHFWYIFNIVRMFFSSIIFASILDWFLIPFGMARTTFRTILFAYFTLSALHEKVLKIIDLGFNSGIILVPFYINFQYYKT